MKPEVRAMAEKAILAGKHRKNINYMFKPGANLNEYNRAKVLGGSPGATGWLIQQVHYRHGVQVQVSKAVSDDLLASDFSSAAKMENVPWLAPSAEFYFEDPRLPTILVMKSTPTQLEEWFPKIEIESTASEYVTALMQESKNDDIVQLNMQLRPEMYDDFMNTGQLPAMAQGLIGFDLYDEDNAVMCYMMHLVLKVFAFASIPAYKPSSLTRKQMHHGGKPDVCGRPQRPSMRVTYLPSVVHFHEKIETKDGSDHEFHGRRGHMRWYRSERFVNRQDTWDFMRPINDPKTGKPPVASVFKVRKP